MNRESSVNWHYSIGVRDDDVGGDKFTMTRDTCGSLRKCHIHAAETKSLSHSHNLFL